MTIRVWVGALEAAGTEALLRPVRSDFAPPTGVSRRLELLAGDSVARRLESLGELPVGGAVLTPSGDLAASFLIHVVVESREERVSETGVRKALQNGLRRSAEWGVESVALPALGVGVGNLEVEDSARVVLEVLHEHLREGVAPRDFLIVVENAYEEEIFQRAVEAASRSAAAPGN